MVPTFKGSFGGSMEGGHKDRSREGFEEYDIARLVGIHLLGLGRSRMWCELLVLVRWILAL